jgi:transcriptional regulator with XRE-family HTH domain
MATSKDLPQDIGGFIRDLRQAARISLRQLAERAGVSNPYLSQIERGLRKPSAEVLQQLASALRVSTPAMYLRAGLLDSEGQQGVLAAIAVDPELTLAQKQSLSQIYETFRNENARHTPPAAASAQPDEEAGQGDPQNLAAVVEDVAVVEVGAAPPPPAHNTTKETL